MQQLQGYIQCGDHRIIQNKYFVTVKDEYFIRNSGQILSENLHFSSKKGALLKEKSISES